MMGEGAKSKVQLENTGLLISDFEIDDPRQLVATVGQAYTSGIKSLVIIAKSLSEQSTAVLVAMSRNPKQFHVIAMNIADDVNRSLRKRQLGMQARDLGGRDVEIGILPAQGLKEGKVLVQRGGWR